MCAEFKLNFSDNACYVENRKLIEEKITSLKTFFTNDCIEYHLAGYEIERQPKDWLYDVRFFLRAKDLFIEISAHPLSIETDLTFLFTWFKSKLIYLLSMTKVRILVGDDINSLFKV